MRPGPRGEIKRPSLHFCWTQGWGGSSGGQQPSLGCCELVCLCDYPQGGPERSCAPHREMLVGQAHSFPFLWAPGALINSSAVP